MIDRLGRAEGYVAAALLLSATGTTLLLMQRIDQGTWSNFVQWVWSALVLGGAAKVWADRTVVKP